MRHIIKPMRDSAERRGWSGTEEVGISSEFVVEIDRNGWIFEKKGIGFGFLFASFDWGQGTFQMFSFQTTERALLLAMVHGSNMFKCQFVARISPAS